MEDGRMILKNVSTVPVFYITMYTKLLLPRTQYQSAWTSNSKLLRFRECGCIENIPWKQGSWCQRDDLHGYPKTNNYETKRLVKQESHNNPKYFFPLPVSGLPNIWAESAASLKSGLTLRAARFVQANSTTDELKNASTIYAQVIL